MTLLFFLPGMTLVQQFSFIGSKTGLFKTHEKRLKLQPQFSDNKLYARTHARTHKRYRTQGTVNGVWLRLFVGLSNKVEDFVPSNNWHH